ncbi:MAG: hypothetical protein ABI806_11505 [Candidatus Solibacter sp.]
MRFPYAALALLCASLGHAQITLNNVPTRQIGQPQLLANPFAFPNVNPNLVEGRELNSPYSVALDTSVSPPRLYVSDSGNNRILAWKDAVAFTNGAKADLVIGQRDFFTTGANSLSTGFAAPTGIAVDQGDLYVADSANNRVMRFRKPFATPPDQLVPDLCIGQPSFNSRVANYPAGQPTEKNIALSSGNVFTAAVTFDAQHNLWLTDSGNNRVLRYAAADIAKGGFSTTISANLEIGQLDFISKQPNLPQTAAGLQTLNQLATPAAIAFDSTGRLYIADSDGGALINRVLVFEAPFTTGMSARRIMGAQPVPVTGAPPRTDAQIFAIRMNGPSGIFFLPGTQGIAVVDTGFSRILVFDTYDKWDPDPLVSPSAKALYGHATGIGGISSTDTKSLVANDGNAQAGAGTLNAPSVAVLVNNELYVADTRNHRVVVLPLQNGNFGVATRVLGQDRFDTNSINLIEGREFFFYNGSGADAGLVIDSTTDTPHLYVSDPFNNRVLGFRDVRKLVSGGAADIVIGQPGLTTALCNYPAGDINQPSQTSLCHPVGLLVDSAGNLYVADQANGRVLRFPTPFSHQGNQQADLVLGKSTFASSPLVDPSARNMYLPYGLTFAGTNGLLVSDQGLNRVLFFPFNKGTFTSADNGAPATKVFGQPDFISGGKSSSDTGMNAPRHMAADTDGRPYVVDSGNGRVLIFDQILNTPNTGAHASFALPTSNAEGIYVNPNTGEIWVTDANGNAIRKYPRYDQLIFNSGSILAIQASSPVAVTQDQYGDLIVAEAFNRVTFYYPALSAQNAAVPLPTRALAPNAIGSIFPAGIQFGKDTADAFARPNPLPLPTELADIKVTVNGTAAPLYYVSPGQINFVMPWNAPTTGVADVQVLKVSTGQLLAASNIPMNVIAPGIFVGGSAGAGNKLAAIINQDGSINDSTHPAKRGEYISIYATGQGPVSASSQPADGDIPRNGLVGSLGSLRVFLGSDYTDQVPLLGNEQRNANGDVNFIQFSGLSPSFPGMWQVNVRIPQATAPGAQPLSLQLNSVADNVFSVTGYRVVFYVAPL